MGLAGLLRLGERHVVRLARGGRRGRAGLGGQSAADGAEVAKVLKQSATGTAWNRELGWGRLDAASAVQLALETKGEALRRVSHEPRPIHSSPPS